MLLIATATEGSETRSGRSKLVGLCRGGRGSCHATDEPGARMYEMSSGRVRVKSDWIRMHGQLTQGSNRAMVEL